jgi:hypothetical protein
MAKMLNMVEGQFQQECFCEIFAVTFEFPVDVVMLS